MLIDDIQDIHRHPLVGAILRADRHTPKATSENDLGTVVMVKQCGYCLVHGGGAGGCSRRTPGSGARRLLMGAHP
jgi:hypothetical protein